MSKHAQLTATPVIFDHKGRAMQAKFSLAGYGGGGGFGDYEAARNSRERTLYNWSDLQPRPESEMLPMWDRLRIIAYLRKSVRNNPVMAALCFRYALAVGSPTVHAIGPDGDFNDVKERQLERRLRTIMYGTGWSWHRLHKIISAEELLAGEVFAVEVEDKVQLIPSEMCGSPAVDCPPNEIDGIGYDTETCDVLYYRFGKRIPTAQGARYTNVTFNLSEGAQLVDAAFVSHLGSPSRIEERRYSPKLSSVIGQIQNLDDIIKAKVTTVKNQSAMSIFFTKNFDPAMWAENSALNAVCEGNAGNLLGRITARSNYQAVQNGQLLYGEVGEDVKLIEPNLNAQDFDTFSLSILDQICAPIGIPAEEVLIGYRKSNYSSARADRNKMADVLKDVRKDREAFCDRVVERQTGIAVDSGDLENQADGIADITYGWPIIREIDETKHILAQVAALESGLKSPQQLGAENGTFSDQTQNQIVASAVLMAKTIKAWSVSGGVAPTRAEIKATVVTEAQILAHMPNAETATEGIKALANADAAEVNADANATRAKSDGIAKIAGASPIGAVAPEQAKPALIESIGIGGTQALVSIIQQVSTGAIPREQGVNTIVLLFGITETEASKLVPPQASAKIVEGAENAPAPTA